MGSLPKLDILQKKTPEKFLKNLLLEAKLVKAEMGNLCSMGASAASKKVPTPPHTLEDLLYELQVKNEISSSGIDTVIESNNWAKMFRQYLKDRKLDDDVHILRFLVLIQPLKICSNINNNQPPILGHDKLHKTISEADKKRLFSDIFQTFLSEDSESMLPLSNQALWADLQATYNALQNKTSVTNEALNQILQVRRDANIWDEGLEPSYIRFLKQTPPPTLAACILSIL